MEATTFSDVILSVVVGLIGWLAPVIQEMKRNLRDLYDWHKPNDDGIQPWRRPEGPGVARQAPRK